MIETAKGEKGDRLTLSDKGGTPLSRSEVLQKLAESIQLAHGKVTKGRSRNSKNDKTKQEWLRAQGYLSGIYLQGLKDMELELLAERITRLEERQP